MGEEGTIVNSILCLHSDRWCQTEAGDHIVSYKSARSLYCTPETSAVSVNILTTLKNNTNKSISNKIHLPTRYQEKIKVLNKWSRLL